MFKKHCLDKLSSYLDNQLSGKTRNIIEAHLKDCKTCSEELARLKLVSERIKAWESPGPGADFELKVRNKIVQWELERGEVKMKRKLLPILIPSGVLVGVLVFVFVGLLYRGGYYDQVVKLKESAGNQFAASKALQFNKVLQHEIQKDHFADSEVYYGGKGYTQDARGVAAKRSVIEGYVSEQQSGNGPVIVIQPTLPATGQGDKIIRIGTIDLEVEDGKDTYKKAAEICQEFGGYLGASRFYKNSDGREAGAITMRIPKDKFTLALDRLSALGKVKNINTDSQDVSQEYANLKSELDAAMVVYNKMMEALNKRQTNISDAARLESELTPVLKRIENLKNKIEYLNNAVSFTTVTVNFYEAKVSAKALKETKRLIGEGFLAAQINAVKSLAQVLPYAFVIVVLGVVLIALILVIKNWIKQITKRE
jgi:hypothetical protein